ncbi:MAG TPA: hypothetical protein P5519_04605 [Spirochaetia bacterium]|nr:hypothetical protein [Spirochaetales bacterium]HRS65154.1 hypothetical protein [Spirochaetia bacterium]HOT60125.1 hypothetical protein [Spirochaetales bacterium]HPD81075.1 hypothetical protein [Spirochaetales bacterium]HQK34783.1 hypothetical protein [Spirochaetales bacterium]
MKQLINYQDNIFFIQNLTSCLEEAMLLELNHEFTGSLLETLIEMLHSAFQELYRQIEINAQLKDQSELLRLCALAGTTFMRVLKQLSSEEHAELIQSNKKLTHDIIKSMLAWHEEKTNSLMTQLSNEEHDTDKLSGLSSDELSGLLG